MPLINGKAVLLADFKREIFAKPAKGEVTAQPLGVGSASDPAINSW